MQGVYLIVTMGVQFFLLVGFLFYLVFRAYAPTENRVSMLSWLSGIIALLILGLTVSITIVAVRMPIRDLVVAAAIGAVDIIGLYLIVDDTTRISRESKET